MKCNVCGADSGRYPLCKECNKKRETGEIIKCPQCQKWHYASTPCTDSSKPEGEKFLYELKSSLVTQTELKYLNCIKAVLPENCLIQPQANLASFITRTDDSKFQNELYRNIDFIITDPSYRPLAAIEINDQTHLTKKRQERDKKVDDICEEAGIPIIKLWTSYGVNAEYIERRITETLSSLPIKRVHHFTVEKSTPAAQPSETQEDKKNGCYIATCVYGSYDCPQVCILRRFRDEYLRTTYLGRLFIKIYYAVSPTLVKLFGDKKLFKSLWKKPLDTLVLRLYGKGIADSPYTDLK